MLRSLRMVARYARTPAAIALLSVLITAQFVRPAAAPRAEAAVPSGLPTHFGFGLEAGYGDTWMPQSGIAWDYRFQYLVGGVNTKQGWETWNTPTGAFATNYAREGGARGYIPMFPYYELLQSNGSCNSCNENQRDVTNLNDASIMGSYYANFALLMQRLGPGKYDNVQGYGQTALVNIEPDFAGGYAFQAVNNGACFNFCTGRGNDPSLLKASVVSAGHPDITDATLYPDNFLGFTRALAHLRDLYAPNVLLGYEVSPWATGDDIGLDSNPLTNVTALGQQVGTFIGKLGAHELLFNDPLDRDAGQYKALFGQNRWWDRNNVTLPNFARWEQYIQAASVADGSKPILLWQVPNGNQYFDTVNNTTGHYQDNRPEYIFGHIPELIDNGVIGVIFGAGNAGNTTYNDSTGDGITNAPSFCTTDGISSGQICNTHVSTYADDDGGYIRLSAQSYYTNPIVLSGGSPSTNTPTSTPAPGESTTPTPPATATATAASQPAYSTSATAAPNSVVRGTSTTISANVTSSQASTSLVDVEVYDAAVNKVFQQAWDNQVFAAGQPRTFTTQWTPPATAATGIYTIMVGVFSPGWGTVRAWNSSAGTFSVTASAAATNTATSVPTSTATRLPTNTATPLPTNTAVPTVAATPAPSGLTLAGSASPGRVRRGSTETLSASVTSDTTRSVLIDLEVYGPNGARVFQQGFDNQALTAGQPLTVTANWSVPATAARGSYTVRVGVFSTGWGTLYAWNGSAASFSVR